MLHWHDQGILLSSRRHGETSAILEVFTESHGRHLGFLRGAFSRKMSSTLQPGTQMTVEWRARLSEHLGYFRIEPIRSRAASILQDRLPLAALSSACSLLTRILAERQPADAFYRHTVLFLDILEANHHDWMVKYLHWELQLLQEAGRGLNLNQCGSTGMETNLRFVSSHTGAALSEAAGRHENSGLLKLPPCLVGGAFNGIHDFATGLELTGYFLEQVIAETAPPRKALAARHRLENMVDRMMRFQSPRYASREGSNF